MKSKYPFLILFLIIYNITFSQVSFNKITDNQKNDIAQKAQKNIKELGERIKLIASIRSKKIKNRLIKSQLKYFIPNAKIETINIGQKKGRPMPISKYLYNTINKYQKKYEIVDIEFVSFKIDELTPVEGEKNKYYFNYTFQQIFKVSYKKQNMNKKNKEGLLVNWTPDYGDITSKGGKIIVERKSTIKGTEWKLYFGDIKAYEAKAI